MNHLVRKNVKTLKEAVYDTIHGGPMPIDALAERLDMGTSYLYRSALPDPDTDGSDASGVRFPLKKLVPLCMLTNDCQIVDVINFQLGRVSVPLPPKPNSSTVDDIKSKALEAVVEFGELIKEVQASILDGRISEREQQQIDKEGREAIQAIMVLLLSQQSL